MSLDSVRKYPLTDEDDALLDSELVPNFEDTPESAAVSDDSASDMSKDEMSSTPGDPIVSDDTASKDTDPDTSQIAEPADDTPDASLDHVLDTLPDDVPVYPQASYQYETEHELSNLPETESIKVHEIQPETAPQPQPAHDHTATHSHGHTQDSGHDHTHEHHDHHEHDAHHHEHTHKHTHGHTHDCDCGHDHEHEEAPARELKSDVPGERRIYRIRNLSCAHCAAVMEEKIRKLPGVSDAVVVYATKQLRLAADNPEARLDQIRRVCMSVEPDAIVEPLESTGAQLTEEANPHELRSILIGAALMLVGVLLDFLVPQPLVSMFVLCLSYVILGGDILLTALKNIKNGHVFDENFLMSLATLGAIAMGTYTEAVGVMLFYRIGEFFEHRAVEKSRRQIMEAIDLRPEVVHRIDSHGVVHTVPAAQAQVGDLLLVRPGDRIPLDGIVRAGDSRIDTSPVTGEPVPVGVHPGSAVTSGCVNSTGALQLEVTHTLSDSMVTRILDAVENAAASKPKMDRFVTRFSRIYTPIVVVVALLTAIVPSVITGEWSHWLYTALSFLVISCPCALVLSVPLSFFAGIGAGSRHGILFKGGASLEALRHVHAVAMDKTGTLTKGNFVVQRTIPAAGINEQTLLSMAATSESQSTHPIAQSVLAAARERGIKLVKPDKIQEIAGQGIVAMISGMTVLCGNRSLLETAGIDLSGYTSPQAGTEVLVSAAGRYAGCLVISDTIKPTAKSAMKHLRKQDLVTVMLTGDAQESAESVAKQLDIQEVRARLLPEQKLEALKQIRQQHGAVLYVGDGINDAPVLANADVGAAMGSGADAAIEAADIVFMTSDPLAIVDSVDIARISVRVARQNVVFALVIKIAVMLLGLAGIASLWLAVFADTGVAMLCVLNAIRILYKKG